VNSTEKNILKIPKMDLDFSSFLKSFLKEKKIDVSVYHSYLVGILEDTIDEEEKREMVLDIVSSLIVRPRELFLVLFC
jgi:hypothetical protein